MLYKFQSSILLQNIISDVQFQQDTLQLCKFESEKDELFINYVHAAAKRYPTALQTWKWKGWALH